MSPGQKDLTCEVELAPGERLVLPQSLVENVGPGRWVISVQPVTTTWPIKDHTAFLRSYSPEDEGLYDDCVIKTRPNSVG